MMKKYYKVLERIGDKLVSCNSPKKHLLVYSNKFWTKPFAYMVKKKLGSCVFSNYKKAENLLNIIKNNQPELIFEIWECEVGNVWLPTLPTMLPFSVVERIRKRNINQFLSNMDYHFVWPDGTKMTNKVKLIKEVK
jgi:hypothetical protein